MVGNCSNLMLKMRFYIKIKEDIYMEVPLGYGNNLAAQIVCKLKKALYGLKQSPRVWFGRFARVMVSMGYRQS